MKIPVKIVNYSLHDLPEYQTEHSSGVDLKADLEYPLKLEAGMTRIIGTGIHIQMPLGYEAQIRSRSGFAATHGVFVLNSPGTIDRDYTGEIKVILHKVAGNPTTIKPGDRIAQMVFVPVIQADFYEVEDVDELETTVRGSGGFGSTGER